MARRARQKRRRAQNPGPRPTQPQRENVPGALDHASGDVEEFEAGIIAGAEGIAPDDEDVDDEELWLEAVEAGPAASPRGRQRQRADRASARYRIAAAVACIGFLRASAAELRRVQWPDRRQVGQATAVVIGFVVIAGAYLGLADVVARKIIDFIL